MGLLDALLSGLTGNPDARPIGAGVGNSLAAGLQSFANSGGLGSAVINGVTGLMTGERADPEGRRQAAFSSIINGPGDQQSKIAQLTNMLVAGGDLDGAKKLFDIANANVTDRIKNYRYGLQDPGFADTLRKENEPKFGLNPVYGTDAAGNPAMIQLNDRGGLKPVTLPNGFSISKNPLQVNTGTGTAIVDPITRNTVREIPKDVGGVVEQEALGKSRAEATLALPNVMDASKQMLKTIDLVDNHPGKGWSLGAYDKVPTLPGSPQADFRTAVGQLQGQTFLQAYQTLKGGGAITDVEGQKATSAIARLNMSQSPEAFNSALKDLREVVQTGMLRANAKARGPLSEPSVPKASLDPLGLR